MRPPGLVLLAVLYLSASAVVAAPSQIIHIQVDAAIVRPIDSSGHHWDGVGAGEDHPGPASALVKKGVKALAEKPLIKAGLGVSLAPALAAYAIDKFEKFDKAMAPPDPFGELVVDGRAIGTLPVVRDTFTPQWSVPARAVEIHNGAVEVHLTDSDLSGAHDEIGACTFKVPTLTNARSVTLTSSSCTNDLLAVSITIARATAPTPIRVGRYRVLVARAGLAPTDRDGTAWDVSGGADPQIAITVGTQSFTCSKNQGQRVGVCEPGLEFDLEASTTIELRVVEVDALVDDYVGTANVGDLLMKQAGRPIAMAVGDSLAWAEVVLQPVSLE